MQPRSCFDWIFGAPLGFLLVILLCSLATRAGAADPAAAYSAPALPANVMPYPQMGAPQRPKVPATFNTYHDYSQATMLLQALAGAYPEYASLQSIGQSYGGREMWVLTITDPSTGPADSKPGMWIDGAIHANEIQATEVVLYTAWFLLETRASNSYVERLLKERSFYLLPMMSPDSRDSHFYEANTSDSPRTGQRPVDDDRDGLVDEDGPEDIDGDGNLCQMRYADPNGRWKTDPEHPERMKRCDDTERGTYSLIWEEGIDNDGDGQVNEDGPGGYDPNRNWGWNWQPQYVQWGAHDYPFSIMENRYVADFLNAHRNIAGGQTYHNSGGMILHGPGAQDRPYDFRDDQLYRSVSEIGVQMLPGYKPMVVWEDLYTVYGGEFDWMYNNLGMFAMSNELFTTFDYFNKAADPNAGWQGSRDDQRKFDDLLLFDQGYVQWHEVDHPTYGKVEVGGQKKGWGRQPPSFMLEEECHRNMAFSLYHADMLPLVAVQSVTEKELPGGLREITAVVINQRMIPTHLNADLQHGCSRPDWVSLTTATRGGASVDVIAGYLGSDMFFQTSTEQKHQPWRLSISNIPGNGAVYCRWIVRAGSGDVTVTVDSVKGGKASASL